MSKLKLSPLPVMDKRSNFNLLGDKKAGLKGYEVNSGEVEKNIKKLEINAKYKELLKKVKEYYKEFEKEGVLLPSAIAYLEDEDKELAEWLLNRIKETEPTVYKKEDFIQQLIINNIIVNTLLELMDETKSKETKEVILRLLSLLSYEYLPNTWLLIFRDKVVKLLGSIKDEILKFKGEDYE